MSLLELNSLHGTAILKGLCQNVENKNIIWGVLLTMNSCQSCITFSSFRESEKSFGNTTNKLTPNNFVVNNCFATR